MKDLTQRKKRCSDASISRISVPNQQSEGAQNRRTHIKIKKIHIVNCEKGLMQKKIILFTSKV